MESLADRKANRFDAKVSIGVGKGQIAQLALMMEGGKCSWSGGFNTSLEVLDDHLQAVLTTCRVLDKNNKKQFEREKMDLCSVVAQKDDDDLYLKINLDQNLCSRFDSSNTTNQTLIFIFRINLFLSASPSRSLPLLMPVFHQNV